MTTRKPFKVDEDPEEINEWVEAFEQVRMHSSDRARTLVDRLTNIAATRIPGWGISPTDYVNTIPADQEPAYPGDIQLEARIEDLARWNAAIMVLGANQAYGGLGGHISTYASIATVYEVGLNHFFRGRKHGGGGDHLFFQAASSPGLYARSFLEGRLSTDQIAAFRRESVGGLPSYTHPRSLSWYWEFPGGSMGLGPLNAIYQARFDRYLLHRGIRDTSDQRVWAFAGDGEMDEPEAIAGLTLAAREGLDNLTLVINCNLQRLDGPVRGNGKVIQEFERLFRGAGWRVVKLIWDSEWDRLFGSDTDSALIARLNHMVDGEFQLFDVSGPDVLRAGFFSVPELKALAEQLTDERLQRLGRGGHDRKKVYAAMAAATVTDGRPTVILVKTLKGYGLGSDVEARNTTHQAKKLSVDALRELRDRLEIPLSDQDLESPFPFYRPDDQAPELRYLLERRAELGGFVPSRDPGQNRLRVPTRKWYDEFFKPSPSPVATTMGFVRILRKLMLEAETGDRVVPIVADEARTFGMETLFARHGIYSPVGQLYQPVDSGNILAYREAKEGQVLEEGITEAGAMASFTAASTAYATHGEPMIPFFVFYSIFGFQRVADMIWSLADQRGRGFLLGATHGRTTLNGEGFQHQDGHSLLLAETNPACIWYDPAFVYETAVIIDEGLRRMFVDEEDIFFYLTLYNEPIESPAMPKGARDGILKGLYLVREGIPKQGPKAQILASGSLMIEAFRAQRLLADDFELSASVWSATSYHQLRADALKAEHEHRLSPSDAARTPYVTSCIAESPGPVVAVSDSMRAVPDLIARWVPRHFTSLGTDGFGRSDTRAALRRNFEVDAPHIVIATLSALADLGEIKRETVGDAIERYGVQIPT